MFPAYGTSEAQEATAGFLATSSSAAIDSNYASYKENLEHADIELARLLQAGHYEKIGSWEDVLCRLPEAMATKLAVLVKEKPDGTVKVRFIVGMLRSGISAMIEAGERIVLPQG